MLLSNPQVVQLLNTQFVPYWESVRPVPKVTIDFGNGHKMQRTLMGNTVMYLCLPNAQVVDALPGVYTPEDFLRETNKTLTFLQQLSSAPEEERTFSRVASTLAAWHRGQVEEALLRERQRITFSKSFVESPLLNALGIPAVDRPQVAQKAVGERAGEGKAVLLPANTAPAMLKSASRERLVTAFQSLSSQMVDISKRAATVQQLEQNLQIARKGTPPTPEQLGREVVRLDSRNNVNTMRPAVHVLLATYSTPPTPKSCRDILYKQLLHVPLDDPNLGLADALVPGTPHEKQ